MTTSGQNPGQSPGQNNTKHETKCCPRCQAEFECKSGSILLCQCQTIVLSDEQMYFISSRYEGCLCINCLHALRTEFNLRQHKKKIQPLLR